MKRCLLPVAAICLALGVLAGEQRDELPDSAAQKNAEKLIKDLFKTEYAQRDPAEKSRFARRLLDQAQETKNDPAGCYVLLRESRDLAVQLCDVATIIDTIDETARRFVVNAATLKLDALSKAARNAATPELNTTLAQALLALIDESIAIDEYETAAKLASTGENVARKAQPPTILIEFQQRGTKMRELARRYDKVKTDLRTLQTQANDPAANFAVGSFLCFEKNNWDKGLPVLARGSDATLKTLAEIDVTSPVDAAVQTALADGWYESALKDRTPARAQMLKRAAFWYQRALPAASGLTKTKIEKRIEEAGDAPGQTIPAGATVSTAKGAGTFLSDLKEESVSVGYGNFTKKGERYPDSRIKVNGADSPNGLYMHPPKNGASRIAYTIGKAYRTFKASVALDDSAASSDVGVIFKVIGDGKTIWESKPIKQVRKTEECSISVAGIQKLELFVDCPGVNWQARAVWVEPQLQK
jgi:hypothetical protein